MKFLYVCFLAIATAFQAVDDMRLPEMSTSGYRKWPSGIVPYVVTNQFTAIERGRIHEALTQLNTKLEERVSFIPRTGETDYIRVVKGSGCWSYVGQLGGVQDLSLGTGCVGRGIIQHEFIHAIGFLHAHQRTDRDNYVEIRPQNMMDGVAGNFRKERYDSRYSTPYDYKSVMHYRATAFSKNGRPTIVALGYNGDLGNYDQATPTDALRATRMYGAPVPTTPSPTASPVACVSGSRGLQREVVQLANGPVTIRWNPRGAVQLTLGHYVGNGKKFNKKSWQLGRTISIRRGRKGGATVRAPGVKFKLRDNELVVAALGPNKLRIADAIINFPVHTLDILTGPKSLASDICRT